MPVGGPPASSSLRLNKRHSRDATRTTLTIDNKRIPSRVLSPCTRCVIITMRATMHA